MDSPKQNQSNSIRLHKYLALCGVASRRACEGLIARGLVAVDGQIIDRQGTCIDPDKSRVTVDGESVSLQRKVYLCLNKPQDVISTSCDTHGRRTILDLLPEIPERIYTVGRLDRDSEGLLLVTNDGDLSARLMHPRHHIPKTYHVWLDKPVDQAQARQLMDGVVHEGEKLTAKQIFPLKKDKSKHHAYEIVLLEGKNRQIRRMFAVLNRRVKRLVRVSIGPLELGNLKKGQWRELTEKEVELLLSISIKLIEK